MRLIDADALFKKVKTECNPYGKPTIGFEDGKRVMNWIEQAPTVSGWVSLEDGTPEKKGLYLLIDKYATTIIEYWMDGRWRTVDSDDMPDITHWLLLPTLPEENEDD